MKNFITTLLVSSVFSTLAFASENDNIAAAKAQLNVETVTLDIENKDFGFYITENIFGDGEFPCFRGVIVDRNTSKVVKLNTPTNLEISYSYSDHFQLDDYVLEVCAD